MPREDLKGSRMPKQATKMAVGPDSESLDQPSPSNASETVDQQRIAELAYEFWQARGCPDGSPELDWLRAEQELQGRKLKKP
jgi:hypothetical protein